MDPIKLEHLKTHKQIAYPTTAPWHEDITIRYMPVTRLVFEHLKKLLPETACTFNKVLWILDLDEEQEAATGIYKFDDYYYVVRLREV